MVQNEGKNEKSNLYFEHYGAHRRNCIGATDSQSDKWMDAENGNLVFARFHCPIAFWRNRDNLAVWLAYRKKVKEVRRKT